VPDLNMVVMSIPGISWDYHIGFSIYAENLLIIHVDAKSRNPETSRAWNPLQPC